MKKNEQKYKIKYFIHTHKSTFLKVNKIDNILIKINYFWK